MQMCLKRIVWGIELNIKNGALNALFMDFINNNIDMFVSKMLFLLWNATGKF